MLLAFVPLLGGYMARVFTGERVFLSPVLGPLERLTYRVLRVDPAVSQGWKAYAGRCWSSRGAVLARAVPDPAHPDAASVQPGGFHSGTWDLTFNTASSFVTNTNWQYYGGETTLTYFSQMAGLAVQNFVSAAVGIVVAVALIRGDRRAPHGATGSATSGRT